MAPPDAAAAPAAAPSRRALLAGGAGLVFAFALPPAREPGARDTAAAGSGPDGAPATINAYVRIAPDGAIAIQAPRRRWARRSTPSCR